MRTSLSLLCAAALAALSCSDEGAESSPRPSSVEPSSGPSNQSTRVTIRGDGFLAVPSEQQSGGGAVIDARHRAWLDDVELEAVTWIDAHTLEAIVPVGLPAGPKRLQVENALGKRGALENAFTVNRAGTQTPAALLVGLSVEGNPTTVAVGQALNVTLAVTDTGQESANVTAVTPSVSPAGAATCDLPSPAPPRTIAGLASTTFTWTCTAVTTGDLTLGASVAGTAATSGAALQVDAPGVALSVQLPAALTATIVASRNTLNIGQAVTATLRLINGSASTANVTAITRNTGGTAAATCTQPTPAPAPIPTGETRTFTWTCTPSTVGTLELSATATGPGGVSATPAAPATVLVQTPAALAASLEVTPTTVTVGQAVNVTLTVRDTGQAGASVTEVTPSGPGCVGLSPAPPQPVAGNGFVSFSWTCTPASAGDVTLGASVTGTDANTGATRVATAAGVAVSVLQPAALTAAVSADRTTANVGQAVGVTFTVTNGGGTAANLSAVTPVFSGVFAPCDLANPDLSPLGAGLEREFKWTCTPTAPGTLSLGGIVESTSNQPVSAAPTTVAVQTPASLTGTLVSSVTTAGLGEEVLFTLTLVNGGQAAANIGVGAVAVQAAGATCLALSPVLPQTVLGEPLDLTWTCTRATAGTVTISATVTATDANTGASLGPLVATVDVTWQAALLTATLEASPSVPVDTSAVLTLTVGNAGGVPVSITSVTQTNVSGGPATCGTPAPSPLVPLPLALESGATATFTWSCLLRQARDFRFSATVNAGAATLTSNTVTVTATGG